eukprot:TRINITY_DN60316_c0_g1_i1.p1 TRINITY_DN60316_c0_g1~~TRINITY_DN60316_c0_g1_i1.p1  ORF type:complete len:109 (+),score=11.02 TRINITY_DN60316_c0_g1_i1:370-696(+)
MKSLPPLEIKHRSNSLSSSNVDASQEETTTQPGPTERVDYSSLLSEQDLVHQTAMLLADQYKALIEEFHSPATGTNMNALDRTGWLLTPQKVHPPAYYADFMVEPPAA